MNLKTILLFLLAALALSSCNRKSASIAGNIYLNPDKTFLYIVDDKYAKNNYDIKEDTVETLSYELKDGKLVCQGSFGTTILDISDDQARIFGTSGVLHLDLKKADMKDIDSKTKTLLGLQ